MVLKSSFLILLIMGSHMRADSLVAPNCTDLNNVSDAIVAAVFRGVSGVRLIGMSDLVTNLLDSIEALGTTGENDHLRTFSIVSSELHTLRVNLEERRSSPLNDTALSYLSSVHLSKLFDLEVRTLWQIFERGASNSTGEYISVFLNQTSRVLASIAISEGTGINGTTVALLHDAAEFVSKRDTEIESVPLSVIGRGWRVIHIGAGSGKLMSWLRSTGWPSQVDGLDKNQYAQQASRGLVGRWTGDCSEADLVIISRDVFMEDLHCAVDVISWEKYDGLKWKIDPMKSEIVQKYLRDQTVYYYTN